MKQCKESLRPWLGLVGVLVLAGCGDTSSTDVELGAAACSDLLDNDGDGATDCDDPGCAAEAFCLATDSGAPDTSVPDTSIPDASVPDGAAMDSGSGDGDVEDGAIADAAIADAAIADAASADASADATPACPTDLSDCDGSCRDLTTDRAHCGACGTECAAGEVCSAGSCELSCMSGLTDCDGSCRDVLTDRAHCGACDATCAAGEVCSAGACELSCMAGLTDCTGSCRDLMTDGAHCGACGTSCVAGQVCSSGACSLTCEAGLTDCTGSCRDLTSDGAHCGACGATCSAGEVCSSGACALSCESGLTSCTGSCRDTSSDRANCGACGTTCATGEVCTAGTCELSCEADQIDCSGSCRDLDTDWAHCGACGDSCAAGEVCSTGTCATTCMAGVTDCSGSCVDTRYDPAHCGACSAACDLMGVDAHGCVPGGCLVASCDSGLADCDGVGSNGCEVALATDADDCGACGVSCGALRCDAGACTGFALAFDGDGDEVEFPISIGDLGTNFTFEMWVRPTSADGGSPGGGEGAMLFSHRADCTDFSLEWSGSGGGRLRQAFRYRIYPEATCSWVVAESATTSTVGDWHHVAGVFEGTALRLYVDGSLAGSATQPAAISWTANLFGHWAGRDGEDARPDRGAFTGEIDEIRISDTARYAGASFTPPTRMAADAGTVALWLFDEGTGVTAADGSGSGFDGVVRGASWVGSSR